jgi:hypothetical protein
VDADGNGDPSNATLLMQQLVTISNLNAFQNYSVNVSVPGTSGDLYIGFEDAWAENGYTPLLYPGAIDTSTPHNLRSWVAAMGDGSAPDYTNIGNNDVIGTIEDVSAGSLSGNWLIRAGGTTGAGCATLAPTNTATAPAATSTRTATSAVASSTRTTAPATNTAGPAATDTVTAGPTSTACPIQFTDVPEGSTFYVYIRCLACRGFVNGYPDGTFRPNNNVTRGQLSKIVSNAAGFNDPQTEQLFEDVPPGSTFFDYIGRLASRGVMQGYPCGGPGEPCGSGNLPYFRPNNNATRGQITKIVANAAGFNDPPVGQQFEDVPPGSTFYTYTYQLVSRNIMSGYPCGGPGEPCGSGNLPYFRPFNNATRGQTAKIVANTFYPNCNTPVRPAKPVDVSDAKVTGNN